MHNINRPFDARDKEMKDRLELMAAKLEDVVRSLNDVAAVVEEEEAEMVRRARMVLTRCCLRDLHVFQEMLMCCMSGAAVFDREESRGESSRATSARPTWTCCSGRWRSSRSGWTR